MYFKWKKLFLMEYLISWLNRQWNSRSYFIFNSLYMSSLLLQYGICSYNEQKYWFDMFLHQGLSVLLMRFHDWFSLSNQRYGVTEIKSAHRVCFFSLWSLWVVDHWLLVCYLNQLLSYLLYFILSRQFSEGFGLLILEPLDIS